MDEREKRVVQGGWNECERRGEEKCKEAKERRDAKRRECEKAKSDEEGEGRCSSERLSLFLNFIFFFLASSPTATNSRF